VAGDADRLVEGFERLSEDSRHNRFMSPKPRLTQADIDHLTGIDYVDHFAWCALAADEPGEPGLGVARWFRLAGRPEAAEAAVTVIDDYQGRGIGTLLLAATAESARTGGIRRIVGDFLPGNEAVAGLLAEVGARVELTEGLLHVEVVLPPDYPDGDAALRAVMRVAARGDVAPARAEPVTRSDARVCGG
jgi:GNAT superfamily N-acetyltransferase